MLYINSKKLIRFFAILSLIFITSACKPKDEKAAKQAKLEKLKKEVQAKQEEITALERELNISSETGKAKNTVSIIQTKDTIFKHFIEAQGKVESDENVFVTPTIPGAAITAVYVKRGDHVSKGQVLATQESGTVSQSIEEVKNSLDLATTVYTKQKALWDQKIGSEIQFLTAKNNMQSLKRRLATMQEQLGLYTLRSPINGTIDDVDPNLKVGQIPIPGVTGIRVVNYAKARVVADISENYSSKINAGDQVQINYPDIRREEKTTVRAVGKAIDPSGRTFKVEINPGSTTTDLHPNMIAILKINDYINPKAIVVPVNVIQTDEKGSFLYVIEKSGNQNLARKKYVETGQTYNGMTEIKSGLITGDQVISSGYQTVVEGQPVNL
jgi:membrane fusion protein, multidrug efflux system